MKYLAPRLLGAPLLIALALGSSPSLAAPDTAALTRQLALHSPECGHFSQRRWLADFEIDVHSSGTFRQKDEAIIWRTETPVKTEVNLSAANPDLPPGFRIVLPIMTALLGGDWGRLQEHFRVEVTGELDSWRAALEPTDSRIAARLPLIQVEGSTVLETIVMNFADGDRLQLSLSPATCSPALAPHTP